MQENTLNWYPVYVRYRSEKKVVLELERKGIKTFLPLKKVLKQWSDRKKIVEEPIIPSYIFVHITHQQIQEVLMTHGVVKFIYFSGSIATMHPKQMEDFQLLLALEADLELISHPLEEGTQVIIKAGPFKGIRAEVVTINSKKNIILSFKKLGYSIEIKTSMAYIEPLN